MHNKSKKLNLTQIVLLKIGNSNYEVKIKES